MSTSISAILVDDDKICLDSMNLMAKAIGLNVVGSYYSAKDAIEEMGRSIPDIAILDESMPGLSGSSASKIIKDTWPSIKTLVVTCQVDPYRLAKIWRSGVDGLTEKDTHHKLREAVLRVMEGDRYMDDHCKRLIDQVGDEGAEPVPRMFEILSLISNGNSYTEIAEQMDLSPNTARTYVQRIMKFTGTHDKAQLTNLAIRRGWVD